MTAVVGRRMRDSASWWLELDDGTVTLVVLRRIERGMGGWQELEFNGADEAACEAAYTRHCEESYDSSVRRAGARANHGIKSYL